MNITETIARAIETRLDLHPAVDASQGFIRQIRAGWLAEDVMVALDAAGYAIVPIEPTPEMAKVGVYIAQTGAVLGAWGAMIEEGRVRG